MSKVKYSLSLSIFVMIQVFCISAAARSDVATKVSIAISRDGNVGVRGRFASSADRKKPNNLSFELSTAGFDGLGSRIKDLELTDANGSSINYKTLIPGEYQADSNIGEWSYTIDITPRKERNAAAHISWANDDLAVLMLGDLLPQIDGAVDVDLKLPESWISSNDGLIEKSADAVIVAGRQIHTQKVQTKNGGTIELVTSGEWRFTDAEAAEFAKTIFDHYADLFGTAPTGKLHINILPFPVKVGFGEWQAETRGRNVTIISSDMPFRTQSIQRLHEQLRHEVFHLWVPNLIDLGGNYDWFYEGFALYESLKLGVAVNQISFNDYLDTLSRAATIDSFQVNRSSLIAASENRKIGSDTNIYARGMLVAFLCDAALLKNSKGKRSIETLLRTLFGERAKTKERTDGNDAVIKIMSSHSELDAIIEKYIRGSEELDLTSAMSAIGLENKGEGKRISLGVMKKPNSRQKEILNKLGYNNWRKLSQK